MHGDRVAETPPRGCSSIAARLQKVPQCCSKVHVDLACVCLGGNPFLQGWLEGCCPQHANFYGTGPCGQVHGPQVLRGAYRLEVLREPHGFQPVLNLW
jgi:hypothetical protein